MCNPVFFFQASSLKKTKPTYAVGFATGSPRPYPKHWICNQFFRQWINAPAEKLEKATIIVYPIE
jgi:hypothetical protein